MCLRFAFLLITRMTTWLQLSQREEAWQSVEILILRHQLAVLQRRQPRRPHLNWADRALLAALFSVIPKTRRQGLRLLVTRTRSCAVRSLVRVNADHHYRQDLPLSTFTPDGNRGGHAFLRIGHHRSE